jgi:hypothetical protein
VRSGGWLPEAAKVVGQIRDTLSKLPTASFAVHIMNLSDEASHQSGLAYLDPVHKLVTPSRKALLAGVGDLSKVSLVERMVAKMAKSPEGDLRDSCARVLRSDSIV